MKTDCEKVKDLYLNLLAESEKYKKIYSDKTKRTDALELKKGTAEHLDLLNNILEKAGAIIEVAGGWIKVDRLKNGNVFLIKATSLDGKIWEQGNGRVSHLVSLDDEAKSLMPWYPGYSWQNVDVYFDSIKAPSLKKVREALKHISISVK